jgi:DinB superfamily
MDTTPLALIRQSYRLTHERVLHLVAALSDAQIAWHPTMTTPSVAFHLWHLARWADHLQAAVPGMHMLLGQRLGVRHQIWETDELARQWQLAHAPLGRYDTGMELDPSSALALPPKQALLDYVQRAFAAAEQAVQVIDDELFSAAEQAQPLTEGLRSDDATIGGAIVTHLVHENRHLGMIECLIGLQGQAGTATV